MSSRGQSLVELALALPLLLALALGGAEFARLAMARAGLDVATAAAAAAAARAPSEADGEGAARAAFAAIESSYGLEGPAEVALVTRGFGRGSVVIATGSAHLRAGFSALPALAPEWALTSTASARVEAWRSRSPGSG